LKNNGILYFITRPFARIALRIFFRKIHIANREKVPWGKPLIIAANHPAAFMEPCLLSVLLPTRLYFLVRGDYFVKPLYSSLLHSYNMVPIYDRTHRIEQLKKNSGILDYCYRLLSLNKTILIMAEGHTLHERRLRPIQKGTARMAFGALEKYEDLDLYLVPLAVNYTYADRFRSEVMFEFSEPIRIQDHFQTYKDKKPLALRQMTNLLTTELKNRVLHINEKEDEVLVEQLLEIDLNNELKKVFPIHVKNSVQSNRHYKLVSLVNHLAKAEKEALKKQVKGYFQELANNEITDFGLVQSAQYGFVNTLLLVLGFVPSLLGYVLNVLPSFAPRYVKSKLVSRREFHSSIMVSLGLLSYLIYYVLLFIIGLIVNRISFDQFSVLARLSLH